MAFPLSTRALDELITPSIWNADIVSNLNNGVLHLLARKTADEPVTSSTTLQNDDTLLFAIAANEVWRFHMVMLWTAAVGFDMKWTFTFPGTGTVSTIWPVVGGTSNNPTVQLLNVSGTALDLDVTSTAVQLTSFEGLIANSGSPGTLQFQFAQNTSSATATVVKANSTLWGVKLA